MLTAEIHPESVQSKRQRIEETIEALILLLDEYDGDSDFEDNGDYEPSLGGGPIATPQGIIEDCESDNSDLEPWLSGFESGCPCDDREYGRFRLRTRIRQ